jgi:hypothetical protein
MRKPTTTVTRETQCEHQSTHGELIGNSAAVGSRLGLGAGPKLVRTRDALHLASTEFLGEGASRRYGGDPRQSTGNRRQSAIGDRLGPRQNLGGWISRNEAAERHSPTFRKTPYRYTNFLSFES